MKTNWKNLANYDYLGAYSLNDAQEVTLTISNVKRERVTNNGGSSEDCIVAYFEEKTVDDIIVKPMVLNKTNCKTISELYHTEYVEDWIGKKITVYATTTKFARDVVPCLRIRKEVPQTIVYKCSICGKEIPKATYEGTIKKYGVALCSKECLTKFQQQANSDNEKEQENIEKGGNE